MKRERELGARFDAVAFVRLDVAWETKPLMPSTIMPWHVYVPAMSACQGESDKFAFGGREAMRLYLTRVRHLRMLKTAQLSPSSRWRQFYWRSKPNTERYLQLSGKRDGLTFRRMPTWMLCKFGLAAMRGETSTPSWHDCTRRLRMGMAMRCERLVCRWCGGGCECVNSSCRVPGVPRLSSHLQATADPQPGTRPICHIVGNTSATHNSIIVDQQAFIYPPTKRRSDLSLLLERRVLSPRVSS